MKKILTFLVLSLMSVFTYCQNANVVDSLTLLINHDKEDTLKAIHINDLVWYIKFSKPDTSLILLDQSEALSKQFDFADGLGNSYNNRAIIYTVSGNFDEALIYYKLAMEQFQTTNYSEGIGFCLSNIAICFEYQSEFDSALVYTKKALAVREKYMLEKGIAQSNIILGVIYFNKGFYKLSLQHYLAALYSYENITNKSAIDKSYLGSIQNNIGNVYIDLGNTKKAIQYLTAALKSYDDDGDSREMSYLYNDFGNTYSLTGDYRLASSYYNKALAFADESDDKLAKVSALLSISSNYLNLIMPDSAYYFANKGIALATEINDKKNNVQLYLNLGKVSQNKGNYSKAISYYKKANSLAEETGIIKNTDEIMYNIAECYQLLGNHQKSNKYLKLQIEAADSILNRDKHRQITEMEAIYENEKKTLLLALKEADNRELKSENKIQNLIIIIAIVIVIALVLFFLYRHKLQITKLLQIEQENEIILRDAKSETERLERKRLANMLHDNIAHIISMSQRQINNQINKGLQDDVKNNLVKIEDNLLLASRMTKVASYELEISYVFGKNIVDQFQDYINRIKHSYSAEMKFDHCDKDKFEYLNDEINENIFSVFQEMLGNAIKYSQSDVIRIILLVDGGKTVLQVIDNGIGFNYDEVRHGLGYKNMKERAEKLNGSFVFESEKGFGTKLKFEV